MVSESNGGYKNIINQLKAYIKQHAADKDKHLLEAFALRYFATSSVEDLKNHTIGDWYHILLSHWKFIYQRDVNESKIKIFNPTIEKDGWQSTHTIIQISHDDIPFLVDSTRMVINRYGYQIHLIIHFGGLKLIRNAHHCITKIIPTGMIEKDALSEAPVYIEIDRLISEDAMQALS